MNQLTELQPVTVASLGNCLGHTKLIFCFSDSAGLFLAD